MPMLISGPTSPNNDINVYLRPLIDELQESWIEIFNTYDAYTYTFCMHAVFLWTIIDFPAYVMVLVGA